MKLNEFIDKNGNQVKIPKSGGTNNTSGNSSPNPNGFKKRLYRVVKYHEHHPGATIEYVAIDKLTEDTVEFTEYHNDGEQVKFIIYIGASTEAWRVQVTSSRGTKDDDSGIGWANLLRQLRYYITVPVAGTPEYKNLLTENLSEWVDKDGKKISLNKSSTSPKLTTTGVPDQTDRYESLVAQIRADELVRLQVLDLTETILALKVGNHVPIRIERKASFPPYVMQLGNHADAYADYEEVLEVLIEEGIIATTDLCESISYNSSSFAGEFKEYETLWEDTSTNDSFIMILGKNKYNLLDDSDLDKYLTQSAKLMRKTRDNTKPLEAFEIQKLDKMLRTPRFRDEKKLADKLQKAKSELEKKLN